MRPKRIALLVSLLACLPAGLLLPLPLPFSSSLLALAQNLESRKTEADRLLQLGDQQFHKSHYQEAIESWQKALSFYRTLANREAEAYALTNIGLVYDAFSEYERAIDYHQKALLIFQQIGNRHGKAVVLTNLGIAYNALSRSQRAIEYHQQALLLFREEKSRKGEATTLTNLGGSYDALSQYRQAIEYHQQALIIFREVSDRNGEAAAFGNLGNAYKSISQYQLAIKYHQKAITLYQQIGNRNGEARELANLGNAYSSLFRYSQAMEYYQRALTLYQQVSNPNGEANVLANLGNTYSALSQYPEAMEYYQQALSIFQQVGDRNGKAATLMHLGNTYSSLFRYSQAMEYYQRALPIFRRVGNGYGEAYTLMNLGNTYSSLFRYSQAMEYYQRALPIFRRVGNGYGEGRTLSRLGFALFKTGNLNAAEETLTGAIQIWETLRAGLTDQNKVSFFDAQVRTYRNLQQVLIAQNKPEAALEIAERGRARAFVELLAQKLSDEAEILSQAVIKAPNIKKIKQISEFQSATLVQYSIIYDNFSVQREQQSQESALYIWVIRPDGKISFRQVDLKLLSQRHGSSLASLIVEQQEFLEVRNRQGLTFNPPPLTSPPQPDLPTLHQLLIEPIADLLPQDPNAHVIFIPQGPLFQVPFPALQDAKGDYLIQKHTILTAPSIQVLALTRQQREQLASRQKSNNGEALVLGNPIMPSVSLSPGEPKQPLSSLPGAESEAEAIATLLNTKAITGAEGTETAIAQKMPQARLIHLATHGLLDDVQGLGSAIALTPSRTDDGLLTAAEILDLQLQADLVVLSACNTARGKVTGDGVIGLSRSLIAAGVPSVLVSLWAVPDAPTAELMTAFYQNLQQNPNKAQAIRQAMLSTMKTHPQPRDWAAFTLIGEAE